MVKINERQLGGITVLDEDGYGTVNASNARIINLSDPINQQDAATKDYVDSITSTFISNISGQNGINIIDPVGPTVTIDGYDLLQRDGYLPMVGDLNLGNNDIINVNLINGINILDHSSRHEFGGQDEVDGYNIRLNYSPVNYQPPFNNKIGEHIASIDMFLSNVALKYVVGSPELGGQYSTIQEAANQALLDGVDGYNQATIFVLDGTYNENISLNSGMNLVGFGGVPFINGTISFTLNPAYPFNLVFSNFEVTGQVVLSGSSNSNPSILYGSGLFLNNGISTSFVSSNCTLQFNDSRITRNSDVPIELGLNTSVLFNNVDIERYPLSSGDLLSINKTSKLTNCITSGGKINVQSGSLTAYGCSFVSLDSECLNISSTSGTNKIYSCSFERTGTSGYVISKNGASSLYHGSCSYLGNSVSPGAINVIAGTVTEDTSLSGKIGGYKFTDEKPSVYYQMPSANTLAPDGYVLTHVTGGILEFQPPTASSSVTPGGINRSIQFNSSGSFDGSSELLFRSSSTERSVRIYSPSVSGTFAGIEFFSSSPTNVGGFGYNEVNDSIDFNTAKEFNLNVGGLTSVITNDITATIGGSFVTTITGVGLLESNDQLLLRGANELHFLSNGVDWIWPTTDGYNGQVLTTDGYGTLSFSNPKVENLETTENDTSKVLSPDGYGGVIWTTQSSGSQAKIALQFVATEEISNFDQWLYSWRGNGSTDNPGARSGASNGLNFAGACSPIVVPANGVIEKVGATLVRGAVNAGTVIYPAKLTAILQLVGFNSMTTLATFVWNITNANTVGTYTTSGINTDYRGFIFPNVSVTQGQLLAVKFIGTNTQDGSNIRIAQNLFINLYLTES